MQCNHILCHFQPHSLQTIEQSDQISKNLERFKKYCGLGTINTKRCKLKKATYILLTDYTSVYLTIVYLDSELSSDITWYKDNKKIEDNISSDGTRLQINNVSSPQYFVLQSP